MGRGRTGGWRVRVGGRALVSLALLAGVPITVGVATAEPADAATLTFSLRWAAGPLPDTTQPIAMSSPNVASLDAGGRSVVVGDRSGRLYAYHLANGSPVSGWPVDLAYPIDSPPSVAHDGGPYDTVFVGTGDAGFPIGDYDAVSASGRVLWSAAAPNPAGDPSPTSGVTAGLTVGRLQGGLDVVAGSLGQETFALSGVNGSRLLGWPFFNSDTTFSTAALADLYGTHQSEGIEGGAQTAGLALGQRYSQGGHLRILNGSGGLICHFDTNQAVDSSPAVGPLFAGGAAGIVVGTSAEFSGASDTNTVQAFDGSCRRHWVARLDGSTSSSPVLADVEGNGRLDVVEGTMAGNHGSVWVLDGATGRTLWHRAVTAPVLGSVVTADLTGAGYQDLLVPTFHGVDVLDGRTGTQVAVLGSGLGFQNSPLVTDDPNGSIGITVAGYNGNNRGVIQHYEIAQGSGVRAVAAGAWPQFHHDPSLSGSTGRPLRPLPTCLVPSAARSGYDLSGSDGGVFTFGQPFCGSTGGVRLSRPIVGMATAPSQGGYWLVASDGGVFNFGGASFYGSLGGIRLNRPIVAMASTPDGRGYWLVASDGGVFPFGDARFDGSLGGVRLNKPIVGITVPADGQGYWLVAADGGVFQFGRAPYFGSMGRRHLNKPIVGMAVNHAIGGYWLVASDGGIFGFGAPFYGSMGGVRLARPIVGIASTDNGYGYRLVAADGGAFTFGFAPYFGSTGNLRLARPIVAAAGS